MKVFGRGSRKTRELFFAEKADEETIRNTGFVEADGRLIEIWVNFSKSYNVLRDIIRIFPDAPEMTGHMQQVFLDASNGKPPQKYFTVGLEPYSISSLDILGIGHSIDMYLNWTLFGKGLDKKIGRMLLRKVPGLRELVPLSVQEEIGLEFSPEGTVWSAFVVLSHGWYRVSFFRKGKYLSTIHIKTHGLGAISRTASLLERNCGSVILRNMLMKKFLNVKDPHNGWW